MLYEVAALDPSMPVVINGWMDVTIWLAGWPVAVALHEYEGPPALGPVPAVNPWLEVVLKLQPWKHQLEVRKSQGKGIRASFCNYLTTSS